MLVVLTLMGMLSVNYGQAAPSDASSLIEHLFIRLVKSRDDADRIRINDSITIFIDSYARSDTVLKHNFTRLKYLGQTTSRKPELKILTWNLLLQDSKSRYYCYFIIRPDKSNVIYRLTGTYNENPVRTDTTYSEKDWYGALYYDLRPVSKDNQTYWVLLGIDYGNPSVTRKIIDAVSFATNGMITFGKKIFESGNETKYREVLEYSSSAVISMKFLSDKSIVFDHLVPVSPGLEGLKEYYGPDFSYDAYNLEKGIWRFETDVDVRNTKK